MRELSFEEISVVSGGTQFISSSGYGNGIDSGGNAQTNAAKGAFPKQLMMQAIGNYGTKITNITVPGGLIGLF
jgi:hypothetical protein